MWRDETVLEKCPNYQEERQKGATGAKLQHPSFKTERALEPSIPKYTRK